VGRDATRDFERLAATATPHLTPESRERLGAASARLEALASALGAHRRLAELAFVAEIAAATAADHATEDVRRVVSACAKVLDEPDDVVGAAVVAAVARAATTSELAPDAAAGAALRTLVALAPVVDASLWIERDGAPACSAAAGGEPTRRAREVAASTLAGVDATSPRDVILGVPALRWGRPIAALVIRPAPGRRSDASALARELAAGLADVVDRARLLGQNVERERSLVESTERLLVRLGFDLHDSTLQALAALTAETRLLREQLVQAPSLDESRALVVGRLDDFEARTLAIEAELRELIQSLELGALVNVPFVELLERELEKFDRTSIEARLDVRGEHIAMTQSQRIAVLRVVQEALSNVRDHSGAEHVHVAVAIGQGHLRAEVSDDGSGFDVARALGAAERSGRLGLVGMMERVRLLGGRLDVRSTPGGPTVITASIPRWQQAQ
jgi:signal transduction histidine kinase